MVAPRRAARQAEEEEEEEEEEANKLRGAKSTSRVFLRKEWNVPLMIAFISAEVPLSGCSVFTSHKVSILL